MMKALYRHKIKMCVHWLARMLFIVDTSVDVAICMFIHWYIPHSEFEWVQ